MAFGHITALGRMHVMAFGHILRELASSSQGRNSFRVDNGNDGNAATQTIKDWFDSTLDHVCTLVLHVASAVQKRSPQLEVV